MNWLQRLFKTKAFALNVSKSEKELLELFIISKTDFEEWLAKQQQPKTRFQFYYPNAIDFYYSEFKLFTGYYKKSRKGNLELTELKMTETNFDTIRCANWRPFEDMILEFLTTLQESKKIALFEKRKLLYEYESLCTKKPNAESSPQKEYMSTVNSLMPR